MEKLDLIKEECCKDAAVLIPIIEKDGEKHILFEVRAGNLGFQNGDICFPGGSIEKDESPEAAAKRECREELLTEESSIEVLSPLSVFSRMSLCIYPFLGKLKGYKGIFDEEVAEVFTVPLSFFLENEPTKYRMEWKPALPADFPFDKINGGENYAWPKHKEDQLFYNYQGRIIWGYTAKILYFNLERIKEILA